MANPKSTFPTVTAYAAGAERQPFSMAFSPNSTSEFSTNITVDREPVKVIAFGLREDEYIEVLHLIGENSGDNFEAYKPFDGSLRLTADNNEVVLGKSGRYRLRFEGTHGSMHCFWWQFSMTHEWANEVLVEGLRRLCDCLQPPPFGLVAGPGISVQQINAVTWKINNTGIINASDSTTIDHNVQIISVPEFLSILSSTVKVSGYEGNLLEVRPDGLYVNLSSQLTACGLGSVIEQTRDKLPLKVLVVDDDNCLAYVDMDDIARYICAADCSLEVTVSVSKTPTAIAVVQGESVTFNLNVTNMGPNDAVDVLVRDVIPASFIGFGPFPVTYLGGGSGPSSVTRSQLINGFYVDLPPGGVMEVDCTFGASEIGRFTNLLQIEMPDIYEITGQTFSSSEVFVADPTNDVGIFDNRGGIDIIYTTVVALNDVYKFRVDNNAAITANGVVVTYELSPLVQPDPFYPHVELRYSWIPGVTLITHAALAAGYNLGNIPPGGFVTIDIYYEGLTDGEYSTIATVAVTDPLFIDGNLANNSLVVNGIVYPPGPSP